MRKRTNDFFTYILLAPGFILTLVFVYLPLPFLAISFMDYDIFKGFNSPSAANYGLQHFIDIFRIPMFYKAILHTLELSGLALILGFIFQIGFALLLNEIQKLYFKRIVQTVSYIPYFLSVISVIGITISFLSETGPLNNFIVMITGNEQNRILFMTHKELFVPIALILTIWQTTGFGTIIYIAAIAAIDPQLYEASYIDGAGRFAQFAHITFPGIKPTAVIMLILTIGSLVNDNFQLVFGLQNAYMDFDVIGTVVYSYGIMQSNFSAAAAFSMTQGVVALILTLIANKLSKTVNDIALF